MKQFLKVIVWILILGGIGYGIYYVLPEYPHNFVKSFVQPVVDSQAKTRIGQIQNFAVPKIDGIEGATYQMVLEKNTGMSCWVYEIDESKPGYEYVIYYGKGAGINLKEYEKDFGSKMSTSAFVKFKFEIKDNKVNKVYPIIDGIEMFKGKDSELGRYKKMDSEILANILQQLMNGMKAD